MFGRIHAGGQGISITDTKGLRTGNLHEGYSLK